MNFSPKPHSIFPVITILILFLGCNEDTEPSLPDLRIYLDRFEEEAALRGYDFDLSEVEAVYVDEIDFGSDGLWCGRGYYNYDGISKKRIEISTSGPCAWADKSEEQRESLFFHEIGHAFLDRRHIETNLCDGQPMSMMNPNPYNLYHGVENLVKREYYISELIDGNIDGQCIDWESGWSNDTAYYQYDPEEYWYFESHDGDFNGTKSDEGLSIQLTPGRDSEDHGKWNNSIFPNLPECSNVTFKVKMNAEQLIGPGAAISLRVFERDPISKYGAARTINETLYLTTTENPISGKLIDYTEELTISCLSRETYMIVIFVRLMAGTEGEVHFSDIRLIVNE